MLALIDFFNVSRRWLALPLPFMLFPCTQHTLSCKMLFITIETGFIGANKSGRPLPICQYPSQGIVQFGILKSIRMSPWFHSSCFDKTIQNKPNYSWKYLFICVQLSRRKETLFSPLDKTKCQHVEAPECDFLFCFCARIKWHYASGSTILSHGKYFTPLIFVQKM